jgi:D-alanyl-D-alanine dipeptidase
MTIAQSATEGALLLLEYFTNAGFDPLASEWWHFNGIANDVGIRGEFFTSTVYSKLPM